MISYYFLEWCAKDEYDQWVYCFQPFSTLEEARDYGQLLLLSEEIKPGSMEINWMEGYSFCNEHIA